MPFFLKFLPTPRFRIQFCHKCFSVLESLRRWQNEDSYGLSWSSAEAFSAI